MRTLKRPPTLAQRPKKDECAHEWVIKVRMLPVDNPAYTQGRAALKQRTCIKCNKVETLDYRIEKI